MINHLKKYTSLLLITCLASLWVIPSCRTIAAYDADTFVSTSTLKAKVIVLMDHASEDYSQYVGQVDNALVDAQKLYAMQKARPKNIETIGHWQKLMEPDPVTHLSVLPGFFQLWKKKKQMQADFIEDGKKQIGDAFDEILKLEGAKLRD